MGALLPACADFVRKAKKRQRLIKIISTRCWIVKPNLAKTQLKTPNGQENFND
jgi:hypothetical protein